MSISITEMKKALLKSGQPCAGMSPEEIKSHYESMFGPAGDHQDPDMPPPAASPAPEGPEKAATPRQARAPETTPAKPAKPATPAPETADVTPDTMAALKHLLDTIKPPAPAPAPAPELDENRLIELIKEHATIKHEVVIQDAGETKKIEGAHKDLAALVQVLQAGLHCYLVGPAGSGKTTLAEQAASALERPFYKQGSIMAKYELVGFTDAGGTYHRTAFRDAFEYGGVMLLDEIDNNTPDALVAMNDALANGSFTFPDSTQPCKRHPDFICIAAANTIGRGATRQYIGRMPLDAATLDRFFQLEIGYDTSLESNIGHAEFAAHGGTDKAVIASWIKEVQALRGKLEERKIPVVVSPRATIAGARMLARGVDKQVIVDGILCKHLSADQRKAVGY